jgi:hypothetical protein
VLPFAFGDQEKPEFCPYGGHGPWATILRMVFPLGSLGAEAPTPRGRSRGEPASAVGPAPSGLRLRAAGLFLACALWLLAALALATHDAADPGFTHAGPAGAVANAVGVWGAWVSDLVFFLFGFSGWWMLAVAARDLHLRLVRVRTQQAAMVTPWERRLRVGAGLVLLMLASTALEWTRLYRLEAHLPGHAGGVLGHWVGPLSMDALGFAGSGVVWSAGVGSAPPLPGWAPGASTGRRVSTRSPRTIRASAGIWSKGITGTVRRSRHSGSRK